ncbi:MAG: hypothetical protein ACPG19_02990 [Saprospiraceae bacterium]
MKKKLASYVPIQDYKRYQTNKLPSKMKSIIQIFSITIIAIFIVSSTYAQSEFTKSDKFVNEKGELIDGNFTVENRIDNENEVVKKFYYDKEGRLAFQRNYDFEGNLMYDMEGVAIYEYQIDGKNNVTEERYFDEQKYFYQPNQIGAALIKRKFNRESQLLEISFFIDNETSIEYGTATIQYEYTENGSLAYERHLDDKGNLVDFCAPIVLIEFDGNNRVVKRSFMTSSKEVCGRFMDDDEDEVAVIEYEYLNDTVVQKAYNKDGKLLETIDA